MKYSLVVYNNDDIIKISGYSEVKLFKNLNEYRLKDITEFTSYFINKEDLISFLQDYDLLPNIANYEFGIATLDKNNNPHTLLDGNITYYEDKYYYNIHNLIISYCDLISNKEFFYTFIKAFDYLEETLTYRDMIIELKYAYRYLESNNYLKNNTKYLIIQFIKLFCYNKKKDIDFKRLRKLAVLLIEFKNSCTYDKEDNELAKEIAHYQMLIANSNDDEQNIAYQNKIMELEKEINYRQKERRKK